VSELKAPPALLNGAANGVAATRRAALAQAGGLHDAQVLRDRLARDRETAGQTRDRQRPPAAAPRDHPQTRLVAERGEHRGGS